MNIDNPFQMNDWEVKKLLMIVLSIQLALWGLIGLDAVGINIPILRQLNGFLYLIFVPGILILRILKLHKLGNIETLLYTVGLSLATLMFTGFFMNLIYPSLGILRPITLTPILITISIIELALCVLCYVLDKDFADPGFIDSREIFSPQVLFLCLIPFLAIFGAHLMNFYNINTLLMLLIAIIAIIPLMIGFDIFITKNLYPLAVFIISIALLYHTSLISMYLWGWDIQIEYYFANHVKLEGIWNFTVSDNVNAMLSIVMLAPIFSDICQLDVLWVFKLIYPILFSLLPLGLYYIYQKQIDPKIAFFSAFYLMAIYTFYTEMIALARQEIAELILMIIILIMVAKQDMLKSHILLIIFGFSLIVSHYGLSYLFMIFSVIGYFFMIFILKYKSKTFNLNFLCLLVVFALSWYMHATSGSAFEQIVMIGIHIYNTISAEILSTKATSLMIGISPSVSRQILRILYLSSQFFIVVGFAEVLFIKQKKKSFSKEYLAFSGMFLGIVVASVFTSYTGMNIHRIFHIVSILLAPFFVLGGIVIFKLFFKVIDVSWTDQQLKSSLKMLSAFLALFLLFNSGWIFEVVKDDPGSIALNITTDYPHFSEQEIITGTWLNNNRDAAVNIYSDVYKWLLLIGIFRDAYVFREDSEIMPNNAYIFLGRENVKNKKIILIAPDNSRNLISIQNWALYNMLANTNKIYYNGDTQLYSHI